MIEFTLPIAGSVVLNGVSYEGTREWKMLLDGDTIYFKKADGKGAKYFTLTKDAAVAFAKTLS